MDKKELYYLTKKEALKNRKLGDRIYYVYGKGYYVITPRKRSLF